MLHHSDYDSNGYRRNTSDAGIAALEARERRERYAGIDFTAEPLIAGDSKPQGGDLTPQTTVDPQSTLKARYWALERLEEEFYAGRGVLFTPEDEKELASLRNHLGS